MVRLMHWDSRTSSIGRGQAELPMSKKERFQCCRRESCPCSASSCCSPSSASPPPSMEATGDRVDLVDRVACRRRWHNYNHLEGRKYDTAPIRLVKSSARQASSGLDTELPTRSRITNKVSKRIALLGVSSPALFAVGAMAQPLQLHSTLAGNNPDIVIGGVQSAGSLWTVKSGFASVDASGRLHVKVRDLILPATGDAGPVTAVSASLVCGGSEAPWSRRRLLFRCRRRETRTFMHTSPCLRSVSRPSSWSISRPPMGIRHQPDAWIAATGGMNTSSQ